MEEEHLLTGHSRSVLALVLDEPRGRLYSSSTDATVRAWDLADMNCLAVIRGHSKPVTHLQLSGGRLLFTAAGGGIRMWCTKTFMCLAKIRTSFYSGAIRSMLVSGVRILEHSVVCLAAGLAMVQCQPLLHMRSASAYETLKIRSEVIAAFNISGLRDYAFVSRACGLTHASL